MLAVCILLLYSILSNEIKKKKQMSLLFYFICDILLARQSEQVNTKSFVEYKFDIFSFSEEYKYF